jgi:hypothetical protein
MAPPPPTPPPPQLFESQLDTWMGEFHTFLTLGDMPGLAESDPTKEAPLDGLKARGWGALGAAGGGRAAGWAVQLPVPIGTTQTQGRVAPPPPHPTHPSTHPLPPPQKIGRCVRQHQPVHGDERGGVLTAPPPDPHPTPPHPTPQAAVCANINLFMEMNEEEFSKFLQTFVTDVWHLLTSVSGRSGQDGLAMAATRFLTTVARSVHHGLFAAEGVLKQICESIVLPNLRVRRGGGGGALGPRPFRSTPGLSLHTNPSLPPHEPLTRPPPPQTTPPPSPKQPTTNNLPTQTTNPPPRCVRTTRRCLR